MRGVYEAGFANNFPRGGSRANARSAAPTEGLGRTFDEVPKKTHARSVPERPACAVRVARVILEPRASSDEHRIVITSPVPRRFHTIPLILAIPLSPWRTESETVLGLSWVAVVGMLRYVGRLLV